jgi:hypothetical protein
MSSRRSLAALALPLAVLALPAASPARAQDMNAICQRVIHPPVGAWSQFRIEGGEQDGTMIRMAVVGSEKHGDTSYIWLEFANRGVGLAGDSTSHDTVTVITKVLVPGYGPGMSAARAQVFKFGHVPAMEIPVTPSSTSGTSMLEDCRESRAVGWESVTVPAGSFRALHVHNPGEQGDAWIDPDLPFAVVKASAGEGDEPGQMVLVAHGMHATSQITETPRPYDAKLFMQMMMQHGGHE